MIDPTATGARSETWRNSSRARIDEMCTSTTGHRHRRHRIAQRHRRMGISAGIEHHTVVGTVGLLYGVDQLAFEVGLEITEPNGRIECFELPEKVSKVRVP